MPGLAEAMPEISPDGKTYTLTLRDGMKYSDGTPIKASDFTFAIERLFDTDSGGSVFYETIVGGLRVRRAAKPTTITGIEANDQTGEITINLTEPERNVPEHPRADVRGAGPAEHAEGLGRDEQPAAFERPVHDHVGRRAEGAW